MLPVPSPAVRQAPSKVFQALVSLAWVKSSFDVTWARAPHENPTAIAPARIAVDMEMCLRFTDLPLTFDSTGVTLRLNEICISDAGSTSGAWRPARRFEYCLCIDWS